MARFCFRPSWPLALLVTLAACTGPAQIGPAGPQQSGLANRAAQGDLLYMGERHTLETFTYPAGALVSKLTTKFAVEGMCSDAKGDVFVAAIDGPGSGSTGAIYEYAHGGTSPIATLASPQNQYPVSCSSDPTTGNLAVTSYNRHTYAPEVEVYVKASGSGNVYTSETLGANPQLAYDASGDLFVTSGANVGAELVKGGDKLAKITFDRTLGGCSHAQWDGKFFALQSYTASKHQQERVLEHIYRLQISGSKGLVVGWSHFLNWQESDAGQSWLQDSTLIATPGNYVAFWNYPAGGKAIKIVHPPHAGKAVTVSAAK